MEDLADSFQRSILKQLEEASAFVVKHTPIKGGRPGYNAAAVREGIVNALVHRDYLFPVAVTVSVFDDEVKIVNGGSLMPPLKPDDFREEIWAWRNEKLAWVFFRLKLMEGWGTGWKRMCAAYEGTGLLPIFEVLPNSFVLELPNVHGRMKTAKSRWKKCESARKSRLKKCEFPKKVP